MLASEFFLQMLRTIDYYVWEVALANLLFMLILPIKSKEMISSTIAVAVFVIIGAIEVKYSQFTLQTDPDIALTDVQQWLKDRKAVMWFVWYCGLFVFENLAIFSIYILHRKYGFSNSYVSKSVLLAFFTIAIFQAVNLTERVVFGSTHLDPIYEWGILSINIGVISVVTYFVISAMSQYCKDKFKAFSMRRKY